MSSSTDLAVKIDELAGKYPHALFMRSADDRQWSYEALLNHCGGLAAALSELGVQPGDRVAAQVEKSPEAVFLYIACLRMGAVFVPINTANTANEVEHFLRDSTPRVMVVDPSKFASTEPLAMKTGVQRVVTLGTHADGTLSDVVRRHAASGARGALAIGRALVDSDDASLAAIVYTSGTTGRSKGAMLTRGNLACNAAVLADAWHFSSSDVLLHTLPLFHIHGLFAAINTVIASGSSLLLLPKFDAASTLRHFAQATVYMGVPTHYTRLLQQPTLDRASTSGMRLFISGSAPLLSETHREFQRRTGHVVLERYGMTETLINTSNPYEGQRRAGSVGPPLDGTLLRVRDTESGVLMNDPDAIGSLEVKGPNVFAGYWMDEAKTRAEFTPDGWFKTGDVVREDADGYVHIIGRAKDLVISGGFNVYPKEVESELDSLSGIAESAVFGIPHPDFGEGVTAAVVCESGIMLSEDEIINSVQGRLARYKIPKRILIVDELPRNAMGKVQKNLLRSRFASIYASPSEVRASPSDEFSLQ